MASESQPKLDLKFKEGETIKVNLNIAVCTLSSRLSLSLGLTRDSTEERCLSSQSEGKRNWDPASSSANCLFRVFQKQSSDDRRISRSRSPHSEACVGSKCCRSCRSDGQQVRLVRHRMGTVLG